MPVLHMMREHRVLQQDSYRTAVCHHYLVHVYTASMKYYAAIDFILALKIIVPATVQLRFVEYFTFYDPDPKLSHKDCG